MFGLPVGSFVFPLTRAHTRARARKLLSPLAGSGADNRNLSIIAGAHKQSLTSEAISDMRSKGSSGADIVEALVENSSTFASKTKFAQEKYILRKQRKCVAGVESPSLFERGFVESQLLRSPP